MNVFARRLKNGRSWSNKGLAPFIQFMVALKDGLDIKTIVSTMENRLKKTGSKKTQDRHIEKLKSSVGAATRNNVAYLHRATGKPIYQAMKGLQGF